MSHCKTSEGCLRLCMDFIQFWLSC